MYMYGNQNIFVIKKFWSKKKFSKSMGTHVLMTFEKMFWTLIIFGLFFYHTV